MEKFNVWKILTLMTFVLFVGCAGTRHDSSSTTGEGASDKNVSGTGNASSGAGTGTGGTETDSAGTGNNTSGAGTGTGGTSK